MAYFHCLIGGGSSGGGYTLTVTCDSQFAGTTITCTDEVTTLTKTCPSASPYEVEFEIPNGGDWTISGVISGQTATTGVSIPTTATLEAIIQKTITIYSAKEDTVTYTDIYGDTQTEVFASGQTSKQITIDIDASGSSITFTSGVAKDPSNLSNYYSKNVTIDSNTTEVYIMPNNALYWYGYMSDDCEELSTANGWTCRTSWSWKSPTYNTNDILLSSGSSGQYYYTGIGSKNKIPLGSVVKAVGTGLSITASACMFVANFNNEKTIPNDAHEYVYWGTANLEELKTLTTTIEDYITAVTWVGGRSGKINGLWYE